MEAWNTAPEHAALPDDAVHLWIASLDWHEPIRQTFWNWLSIEERERARRFRFPELQDHFIAAHGILRDILSRYLRISQASLTFASDDYGKPRLKAGREAGLQFNLSHAHHMAVYAVARPRIVGVDIEEIHRIPELPLIAKNYFTDQERLLIEAEAPERRDQAFLTCWTRKEAYIKAVGRGLSIPLQSFDTSIPPSQIGCLLPADAHSPIRTNWWLTDLPRIPGHVGALAVEGGAAAEYGYWRWMPPLTAPLP